MSAAFEVVVVGTGGIGSAAFFHAAKSGRRVLAIEQFSPAHDRGSSHGQTRIIRQAYFEHPDYVPLLREAYARWRELEQISGRTLFHPSGLLEVGYPDGPIIGGILESARRHGLPIEEIPDSQFARRFSHFRKDAEQAVLFEQNAGYLLVEECVKAHIDAAVAAGGQFQPDTRILSIEPQPKGVLLSTDRGTVQAEQAIIAAGAWTAQLLPQLAPSLRVLRKHQYWFAADDRRFDAAAACPTFFYETRDGYFYGFPAINGLMKIARHTGGDEVSDPSQVDRSIDDADLAHVRAFARKFLGQEFHSPAKHAVCMYTMSPDEHFIIDRHPEFPHVVFCAGLSGHGFKFATVLGRYLDSLLGGQPQPQFDFLSSTRPTIRGKQ